MVRLADLPVKFSAKVSEHSVQATHLHTSVYVPVYVQSMFQSVFQSVFQRGKSPAKLNMKVNVDADLRDERRVGAAYDGTPDRDHQILVRAL